MIAVLLMAAILFGFQTAVGNIQTLPSDFYSGDSVGTLAGFAGTAAKPRRGSSQLPRTRNYRQQLRTRVCCRRRARDPDGSFPFGFSAETSSLLLPVRPLTPNDTT